MVCRGCVHGVPHNMGGFKCKKNGEWYLDSRDICPIKKMESVYYKENKEEIEYRQHENRKELERMMKEEEERYNNWY